MKKNLLFATILLLVCVISCTKTVTIVQSGTTGTNGNCIKITLTSAPGTDSQRVGVNVPIIPITYRISNSVSTDTADLSAISVGVLGALPPGIVSTFSGNTLTLSGSITTLNGNPFIYGVTATGNTCNVVVKGVISAKACATLTPTAEELFSDVQHVKIDSAIKPITYTISNATTASVTGLPRGVNYAVANGVVTISGTPQDTIPADVPDTGYKFFVTTTGGYCDTSTSGVIDVMSCPTLTLLSAPNTLNQTLPHTGDPIVPIVLKASGHYTGWVIEDNPLSVVTRTGDVLTITGSVSTGETAITNQTLILTANYSKYSGCPVASISYIFTGPTGPGR